jgi:hypothetical protein
MDNFNIFECVEPSGNRNVDDLLKVLGMVAPRGIPKIIFEYMCMSLEEKINKYLARLEMHSCWSDTYAIRGKRYNIFIRKGHGTNLSFSFEFWIPHYEDYERTIMVYIDSKKLHALSPIQILNMSIEASSEWTQRSVRRVPKETHEAEMLPKLSKFLECICWDEW